MGIDNGSRVQWTLLDGVTLAQGWVISPPDYSLVRNGTVLVAVDPDPGGVDQLQKSIRAVVCIDIALLTQAPNQVLNI